MPPSGLFPVISVLNKTRRAHAPHEPHRGDISSAKDVPVIFVTAKTSPQDTAFAMKKGAVGYITKPFDIEKLIEMIDKTLNPPPQPEQTPAQ